MLTQEKQRIRKFKHELKRKAERTLMRKIMGSFRFFPPWYHPEWQARKKAIRDRVAQDELVQHELALSRKAMQKING